MTLTRISSWRCDRGPLVTISLKSVTLPQGITDTWAGGAGDRPGYLQRTEYSDHHAQVIAIQSLKLSYQLNSKEGSPPSDLYGIWEYWEGRC